MIKVVFFGTPNISVPALEALISSSEFDVVGVVTEPEKRKGRGQKQTTRSPVFEVANKYNIPTLTPKSIKKDEEVQRQINSFGADVYVVIAYGKIIPDVIFTSPKNGTVNVHYSLLPELRGPSPVQWALLEGRDRTGVTLMEIDAEMDHGNIISQQEVEISGEDTFITLVPKLNAVAVNMLMRDLPRFVNKEIESKEQNHNAATFCKMISKEDGKVDWSASAKDIFNKWRAFIAWPGIYTEILGKRIKLEEIAPSDISTKEEPGVIFESEKKLFISCGRGVIEVLLIKPEGKQVMSPVDFINGHRNLLGSKLTW